MPRSKTLSDRDVLALSHKLIHERGPEALTFESLARACGLSAATLVQRFNSKAGLKQGTLLYAWDRLDEKTATLASTMPKTPEGAISLLTTLSGDYGGIEAYAEGLQVLREDLRDPVLRARGAAWKNQLSGTLDDCFAGVARAPPEIGLLIASHWQGSLLWWGFDPQGGLQDYVADSLRRFIAAVVTPGPAGSIG